MWRSHIAAERYDWTLRHRLHMQEMATGRQVVALAEVSHPACSGEAKVEAHHLAPISQSTATPLLMDALTGELVSETAHTFAAAASVSPFSAWLRHPPLTFLLCQLQSSSSLPLRIRVEVVSAGVQGVLSGGRREVSLQRQSSRRRES